MMEKPVTMLGDYIDLDSLPAIPKGRPSISGFATGLDTLDGALGGIRNELIAVASRPGVGKTCLLMFIAEALASKGVPGVFFTLEMNGPFFAQRAIEHSRDYRATKALPIIIEDGSFGILDIAARLRELRQNGLVQWAMIDYLGLLRATDETKSAEDQSREILAALANIRQELELPILFTLELARGPVGTPADILDSGKGDFIVDFCDAIVVLSECGLPDYSLKWRDIEIFVTKRGADRTRVARVQMNPSTQRFRDPVEV